MTTQHPHSATPGSEHDHDAVLLHALRHAPEPGHAPSDAVRAHVLSHAAQSIAKKPINTSDNAEKMPENSWRQLGRRCCAVLGLRPGRWAWAPLTGGAFASLIAAVWVGLLWHDDGRREQGMQDSVEAAASAPHQGAAPTTAPVPATQELAKAHESAPQSQALAPESAAAMAPSAVLEKQAMPIPAPALAPEPVPEPMAARKQGEERTASIDERVGDAGSGSKVATAPSALPPSGAAPSAAPPSHAAAARASASASAPALEADAGFSAAQPSASTRAEHSAARARQGLSAPETSPSPAPLVPNIADTVKGETTPAPAVASASASASARAPESMAESEQAPQPVSALTTLDKLLLSAGKTGLQCSTSPATAPKNQPASPVEKNCNTAAAHALLGSQLLRSVLSRAVVHTGAALPSDTRYVEWYLPAGNLQPAATLGWSPTQRLLYWRTADVQYSALVNLQQDAASMQKLVNAAAGVGDAAP